MKLPPVINPAMILRIVSLLLLPLLLLLGLDWWTHVFIRVDEFRYTYYVFFAVGFFVFLIIGNRHFPQRAWKRVLVGAAAGEMVGMLAMFMTALVDPRYADGLLRGVELYGVAHSTITHAIGSAISGCWLVGIVCMFAIKWIDKRLGSLHGKGTLPFNDKKE